MFCSYPERVPQKAISKSTARIALANRRQGQSYTFESSTTLFVPCACFYICFQTFLNKFHTILGIIVVFHWIYKPFIFNIFFQIKFPNHLFERENNTFDLFSGKTERNEVSKRFPQKLKA